MMGASRDGLHGDVVLLRPMLMLMMQIRDGP